jgi:methionyl-tRNA synthetase
MAHEIKVPDTIELQICQKCEKIFTTRDIIPLCPKCRYEEAKYQL